MIITYILTPNILYVYMRVFFYSTGFKKIINNYLTIGIHLVCLVTLPKLSFCWGIICVKCSKINDKRFNDYSNWY